MVERFDILILGGGLNGAALALALKDTAYRVALVEAAPPARRQRSLGSRASTPTARAMSTGCAS
jgi:2-polyprenyl-6-methoxyphenol hydroxylase-like FAD-dependent oxidoreductase